MTEKINRNSIHSLINTHKLVYNMRNQWLHQKSLVYTQKLKYKSYSITHTLSLLNVTIH